MKNPPAFDGVNEPEIESAVFETAIQIGDAETRRAFLDRWFRDDTVGLQRIEELLSLVGESTAFFIESDRQRAELAEAVIRKIPGINPYPDPDPPSTDEEPGTQVDGYRLIRRIGEGGCGIVYEAELERVKRRVALKIIRLGMDTESVVARFEVERQALEMMDHPNIAKVLDAGKTRSGRPYFVMELVQGERITSYCDEGKLDVPARLAIFVQVCQAIQHAHQKGIVHRDIKPSNVLVATHDGVAVPKVIDFGIAKATDAGLQDRGVVTSLDQLIGTPVYMSPEQIDMAGIDVDTRSDIYSLGALLYELLAGRAPFDAETLLKSGMSAMRRTLQEQEPPLPSAVVAAAGDPSVRDRGRGRAAAYLRGDLDWIVIKAMEKDRRRRYQTVNSLAMDVNRFLADEPVIARRPSRLYLMGKFYRRNRVACISGIAVALSLVGGLGVTTRALAEQERLKQEAEIARGKEAKLRVQAQARANISLVAILLSDGKVEEADRLLQENPLDSIGPSREAADVFRFIGGWNALYQRWPQALACFTLMNQANRLTDPRKTIEGSDLLMLAPVYLEAGDTAGYETFRTEAVERYAQEKSLIQAEHLLKICLLKPANDKLLLGLKPVADFCAKGGTNSSKNYVPAEWNALSMSLYYYRCGDFRAAAEAIRKCLSSKDQVGTRSAAAHCLSAMARFRLGDAVGAEAELKVAREAIREGSKLPNDTRPAAPGFWFAWSVARIFLAEAEDLIEG